MRVQTRAQARITDSTEKENRTMTIKKYAKEVTTNKGKELRTYLIIEDLGEKLRVKCVETGKVTENLKDKFFANAEELTVEVPDEPAQEAPEATEATPEADPERAIIVNDRQFYALDGKVIVAPVTEATPEAATRPEAVALAQALAEMTKAPKRTRKSAEKSAARLEQERIREAFNAAIVAAAIDSGLRAEENANVPHVVKFYQDRKYALYARLGLKTVQFLMRVESVPAGMAHTTMKYSLPASVVLPYAELFNEGSLTDKALSLLGSVGMAEAMDAEIKTAAK